MSPGKAMRTVQEEARRLGRIKRELREEKNRLRAVSDPEAQVINCPTCGAPMIDSALGRATHHARQPRCKETEQ
jgi:hypothetical protein